MVSSRTVNGAPLADRFEIVAKTLFGLEEVLAGELRALGAEDVQVGRRMCTFRGDQKLLYRANIECRTAIRVLKPIARFPAEDRGSLYRAMQRTNWLKYLEPTGSLAIDPVVHSSLFPNSLYAAQVAKDAICDQIRHKTNVRPNVDLENPDLRINLHIDHKLVTVYLDSSGDSLHRRGYRTMAGAAPVNEVLAAGILQLIGWDQASPLVDFMCGSGTIPIEAALLARRIAPGSLRPAFGYQRWKDYSESTQQQVLAEARAREVPGLGFPIVGSDVDADMIPIARENAQRAGVAGDIAWSVQDMADVVPPATSGPATSGTVLINPPYEERMKTDAIFEFYRAIGDVFKQRWAGYTAYVLTGNLEAGKQVGLRASARIKLFNGSIECRLLKFELYAGTRERRDETSA